MILVDEKLVLSRIEVADSRICRIICGDGSTIIITMDGSVASIISNDSSNTNTVKHVSYKDILFLYNNKHRCDICADTDTDKVEELYNKYKFLVIPETLKETYMTDSYEYRKSPSMNKTLFLLKGSNLYIERDTNNVFKIKCCYDELGSFSLEGDERGSTTFVIPSPDNESKLYKCIFDKHVNSYIPYVYDWCDDILYRNGEKINYDALKNSNKNNTPKDIKKDDITPPKSKNKLSDLFSNVKFFTKNFTIIPGKTTLKFCSINPFTLLMCSGDDQYDSDEYMINISNVVQFIMSFSNTRHKQYFDILTAKNEKCRVGITVPEFNYMTRIGDAFIVDSKPYANTTGEELKYESFQALNDNKEEE